MFIISDLVIEHKTIRIKRKTSVNCACSFAFVNVFILFFFYGGHKLFCLYGFRILLYLRRL